MPAHSETPDFGELGFGKAHSSNGSQSCAAPKGWKGVGEWQVLRPAHPECSIRSMCTGNGACR